MCMCSVSRHWSLCEQCVCVMMLVSGERVDGDVSCLGCIGTLMLVSTFWRRQRTII